MNRKRNSHGTLRRSGTLAGACLGLFGLMGWTSAVTASTEVHSFTDLNQVIPDGSRAGFMDVRNVVSSIRKLSSVRVRLNLSGEFNGDLYAYVRQVNAQATNFCVLLNRAGRSSLNAAGYGDAGLSITLDASSTNDIHLYRAITNVPAGAALAGTWQPDGRNLDPLAVLDISARTTSLSSFNGVDASGEWTLYVSDTDAGGTNMVRGWELELAGAITPPLTWPAPEPIVYGTPLGPGQLNASSGGVAGAFAYTPATGTILSAGSNQTLTVQFTPIDTASYISATSTVSLTVLRAPLTVSGMDINRSYGTANPVFTGTITGVQNGENITATYTCSATPASPVGTYSIVPTLSGATLTNYTVTLVNGTLTVNRAALTISANNNSRLYGDPNPGFSGTITGVQNGENITATYTCSATPASPIGTYSIVPTPSGATLTNYTVTLVNGTLTVNRAALTISANSTNRLYGDPNPGFTGTIVGVKNAESIGAIYSCSAIASSPIGTYSIVSTPSGATLTNYTVTLVSGTLTVNRAALTISASSTNRLYGDSNPGFTGTIAGIKNGENISATYSCNATPSSPTGTYSIVPTPSGATLTNYTVTLVNGTLTINPAGLTVTAASTNRVYGAANPAFTGSIQGTRNADVITAAYNCSATLTTSAGSYDIVPSLSGAALSNYAVTAIKGTLTITRAACSGTVSSSSNPQLPGQPVTFSVTLSPIAPTVIAPAGTVQFKVDGAPAGSPVPLVGGVAAYTTTTLGLGTHNVVAEYATGFNFLGTTNSLASAQLINSPPVAGSDVMERYPTNSATVEIATLLANDLDPDGDPVSFIAVSAASAYGASLSRQGSTILYQPPVGFTNADSFTYTISDGRGTPVTGSVSVRVKDYPPAPPQLTILGLGNGSFRLRVSGVPNRSCQVECTATFSGAQWNIITNGTTGSAGVFEFINTPPTGTTSRFYRALYP